MPLDDEMPQAPQGTAQAAGAVPVKDFGGEIETSVYEKVPEMGEPIPVGTYHFRLDRYSTGWNPSPKVEDDPYGFGAQPYFMIFFVCQQEPETGRVFVDFCPWVSDEVARMAAGPETDPRTSTAQKLVNDRVWKGKAIAEAANYRPPEGGRFNVKTFFATNPELKIQLGQAEKKEKQKNPDGTTKYVGTGKQQNKALAYLPLFGGGGH